MAAKSSPPPKLSSWRSTPKLEKAWLDEARRRLKDADSGKVETLSLEEFRVRLTRRHA